jgi:threonine dehydrogenase-like Zn-dependent dehydrogenase
LQKEITLRGVLCYSDDFHYALPLVADGSVDVDSLITRVTPLDEVEEAFEEHVKAENSLKVLLQP